MLVKPTGFRGAALVAAAPGREPRLQFNCRKVFDLPYSTVPTFLTRRAARVLLAAWAVGASTAAWAQAQAPQQGSLQVSLWAASCMACHGAEGRAEGTGLSLRGRPADQLLSRLLDFKYGRLQATVMHQHAKGYKDEELRLIAEYFANLKR